jgi:signal transduction histidine kinase
VEIIDDGIGGAELCEAGSGLRGMVDRVQALDGRLEITSEPQRGTVVKAGVPIALLRDP